MERMENPFKNLHPKIYHRQKNAAFKRRNVNLNKELEIDHNARLPLSSSRQNDLTSSVKMNSQPVIDRQNVAKRRGRKTRREENSERTPCSDDYNELENLNRRNTCVSRKIFEEENLVLPWLDSPNTSRGNPRSMQENLRGKPFGENNKGLLPPIEVVPSFICLTSGNDRKPERKGWREGIKYVMGPRLTENEKSLWNRCCDPSDRLGEDNGNKISAKERNRGDRCFPECDKRRTLCNLHSGITQAYCSKTDANNNIKHHVTAQMLPSRTNGHYDTATEETRMSYMVLKARIHRSTFF